MAFHEKEVSPNAGTGEKLMAWVRFQIPINCYY
jgi:hypothetical protein